MTTRVRRVEIHLTRTWKLSAPPGVLTVLQATHKREHNTYVYNSRFYKKKKKTTHAIARLDYNNHL